MKEKVNWKDGERDRLRTFWYENGQKQAEEVGKTASGMAWQLNGMRTERRRKKQIGKMVKDGFVTHWYENGQKKEEANWKDGNPDGFVTHWYENGQKKEEANWKDGKRDGLLTSWHENGEKTWRQTIKMVSGMGF